MTQLQTQLQQLAKPFPDHMIHANPGSGNRGSYVKHSAVRQKLLAVVGPYRWAIVDILRDADTNQVCGCIGALTCRIDGELVTVHGAGDCENPKNWPHDGPRLKDAESDAIKRAAMNLGVGLHLWAQDEYVLDRQLAKGGESAGSAPSPVKDTESDPAGAKP